MVFCYNFFLAEELAYAIGNVVERRPGENTQSQRRGKIRGLSTQHPLSSR